GQEHALPRLRACRPRALHAGGGERRVRGMRRSLALAVLFAAACSTAPPVAERPPPPNLGQIPDAEPKTEPLHRYANKPYKVFGTEYVPIADARGFKQRGVASWYGRRFHGQKTASGELYDMYAMTAAHPTLPIPSYVRVPNLANGRSVVVRVNDRGPFHSSRVIDLSYAAAYQLGFIQAGSAQVQLERVQPAREQAGAVYVQVGAFTTREN